MIGPAVSAVVVNPVKVDDLDKMRRTVVDALASAGWPEPMWLETTVDDPGRGQAAQAVRDGAEIVFACGGDGTMMACVTALAGTGVALAVLPAGTGNLLAADLGLAGDLATAFEVVLEGGRRRIDVGVVGDEEPHVGGARIDLRLTFDGFSINIEMKVDSTKLPMSDRTAYLKQAAAYQGTDVRIPHSPPAQSIRPDRATPALKRVGQPRPVRHQRRSCS